MVPGVPCVDHGNWGRETRHCSLFATECGVLRRKFWQESHLIHSSHIQRCRSFSETIGPRIILLENQPGKQSSGSKRSREITTEPIAVWVQSTKTLRRYPATSFHGHFVPSHFVPSHFVPSHFVPSVGHFVPSKSHFAPGGNQASKLLIFFTN